MHHYTYAGRRLAIARFADMPFTMRPGKKYSDLVQRVIHSIKPWEEGEDPIETNRFTDSILPMAVPTGYAQVTWGIHRGHKAMKPGLSPFVERGVPHELMGYITVELKGTPDDPLLIRAYGGQYTPPLPWMKSAVDAPDGRNQCLEFWQSNAYLMKDGSIIRDGTRTSRPPNWFQA